LPRWQNMCLTPAFARWEEQTAEQRNLRVAGSKVVKRWTHKSQALAWGKWQEEVRRSRMVKRAALRWTQKTLYAACSTWGALVTEGKQMRTIGAKVFLRWQQRTVAKAWMTWQCKHSAIKAQQRRMALAADKIARRWINLALSPAMSMWMGYVEEKKRLVRAADKVLLRWQNMCLTPALVRWEEQWREEKRMRRAAETVIRRWQNMRLASAWAVWQEAWEQERERVVPSLNDLLAAAKSDKDAAERQVGQLKDKLKKRSERVVVDLRAFDLATAFLLFQKAVEEARVNEQLRATREGHESIVRKLSEELEAEVFHARAVASKDRQNRLAAVQHLFRLQRRMQLSHAFSMFADVIFRRLEYFKMAAKVIETRGMPTLDVAVMSFLRWRHFIHLHHCHLHQNRVQKLQAHLRLAEEENGIIAAQNAELEEKLVRAALEAERLEAERLELQSLKAVTQEKDKLEARLQQIEKEMADSTGNAGKEVKRLKEELVDMFKKKLEVEKELAKETGALALIQEDQANASAKAQNAELEEKLGRASLEAERLQLQNQKLQSALALIHEDQANASAKATELEEKLDRASLEAERLQLQNQKLQSALLALIQEDQANASAKSHVLDLVGTSARYFASVSSVSRNARPEASFLANVALDDEESLEMRRRAREQIRALAGVMCREGVFEDTVSISMTERQEAHQRKHLDAVGMRVSDSIAERFGSKKNSAQSPALWTSGFKFFPGDSGVGEGENKDRILHKAGVGNTASAHGSSGWTLTPDGSWMRMQPGADDRLTPLTPSPRHPSPAGRSSGGGNRYIIEDRAISISQPSPINLASVPMGSREGWGKL